VSGITIEVPDAVVAAAVDGEWSEPFKLPRSGKVARLREPTVADMVTAQKVVGKNAVSGESDIAVAAAMTELDGKRATYEALKQLKVRDLQAILKWARELDFLEAPSPTDAGLPPS
jgi:hypothetical protein